MYETPPREVHCKVPGLSRPARRPSMPCTLPTKLCEVNLRRCSLPALLAVLLAFLCGTPAPGQSIAWTTVNTVPPARYGHGVAYEPSRGVSLLFGGSGVNGDTWKWDGTTWLKCATSGP